MRHLLIAVSLLTLGQASSFCLDIPKPTTIEPTGVESFRRILPDDVLILDPVDLQLILSRTVTRAQLLGTI